MDYWNELKNYKYFGGLWSTLNMKIKPLKYLDMMLISSC